jgi:hypothetical protein
MEGKLQQLRRQSKERKIDLSNLSPKTLVEPDESQPRGRTPKREKLVVFSNLEQRRRESKERKIKAAIEADSDFDTPKLQKPRVAQAREEEEVFVQVMDVPDDSSSSGQKHRKRPGSARKQPRNFFPVQETHPGKQPATASGGRTAEPRVTQSKAPKPWKQQGAPQTQNLKPCLAEEQKSTAKEPLALLKKQPMVLKVKFLQPVNSQVVAKRMQKATNDRTRSSTRPKKQSPTKSVKTNRKTLASKPVSPIKPPASKQKDASTIKEADRLLHALNLIINSKVVKE